ncbi:MAG: YihY family inner membrane protein [Gammaproteobacteria bacterium]|nr:YihY family inner membrane protein [Gammaproteobacteria bacterium]NVK89562.1 YihY family inner membrane protein [Gammaproteobacteria bacterium]
MEEKLNWLKQFSLFTLSRFAKDRCPSIAAELTVTSLLSLVPLMTVIVALVSLFPQFQTMETEVQSFIIQNLMPESGETLQRYVNQYVKNTQGLTTIGFIILVITSLMLMRTIDKSFNHIWQVKTKPAPVRVFLVYWAVLTMGPLLLAMSLAVSSYFASLPYVSEVVIQQNSTIKQLVPMVMAFVAFSVMFKVVPNRPVKFRHALVSAAITSVLFELAKMGFAVFVKQFSTYQLIFGALASVPLFLIWMQLSWMILLVGAEICHALGVFQPRDNRQISQPLIVAARILKYLAQAQQNRQAVTLDDLQQMANSVRLDSLSKAMAQLISSNLVLVMDNESYTLTGDSHDYRLADLVEAGFTDIPSAAALAELARVDAELAEQLSAARQALLKELSDHLVVEPNQD